MKRHVSSESQIEQACFISPSPSLSSPFLFHSHSCFSSTSLQFYAVWTLSSVFFTVVRVTFTKCHLIMSLADFQTLSGSQGCHAVVHSSRLNIRGVQPFTFRSQTCFQPHLGPLLHLFSGLPHMVSFTWSV